MYRNVKPLCCITELTSRCSSIMPQKQTHRKWDQICGYQRWEGVGSRNQRKMVKAEKFSIIKAVSTIWCTILVTQSCLTLCDPGTIACQAPPSMGFSRQEYWSRLPFPSPGDHPNQGSEPRSPTLQADSLPSEPPGKPCNVQHDKYNYHIPGMVEPGGLLSMRSQRVRHDWSNLVVVVY